MIFVDTGAWFALAVPSDPDHQQATAFIAGNTLPLVTSDYILDELLTLFVVRGLKQKGIEWQQQVLEAGGVRLVRVDEQVFANARAIYRQYADKSWSFTDCTSYVLMQKLQVTAAFAFDVHFRQFGTVPVVP